jgi:hypothetical protein
MLLIVIGITRSERYIYDGFSNKFKIICMCEIAKEACDILKVTYEGTKSMKNLKLQMLTSKFKEIKMPED